MAAGTVIVNMLAVFSVLLIVFCDGLEKGDVGVCETFTNEKKIKVVYPKGCRRKSCSKNETELVKVRTIQCCEGWEYDGEEEVCVAECLYGCDGGRCVAPNKCECDPPFKLKDYKCVMPKCDKCINGECVDDNVCKCNDGFRKTNATHCEPICDPFCSNGRCVAPNVCICEAGYENRTNKCEPICYDCDHGACIAPNQCKCFEGYSNVNNTCSPVCRLPCYNGDCTSPDKCTCNPSYQRVNSTHCKPTCQHGYANNPLTLLCEPHCDMPCEHGKCIGSNICECHEGYENKGGKCQPVCHSCKNGSCVTPNNCRCHDGYSLVGDICLPICLKSCVNGYCTSPDTCTCKEGYSRNETDPYLCNRPCKPSCNGRCFDGECICSPGYVLKNETCVFTPVECNSCNGSCSHGACWCADRRPCHMVEVESLEVASSGLAGLELTWLLGGAIGLLLLILVVVILHRTWKKRKQYVTKTVQNENPSASVVYTTCIAGALLNRERTPGYNYDDECTEEYNFEKENFDKEEAEREAARDRLLTTKIIPIEENDIDNV